MWKHAVPFQTNNIRNISTVISRASPRCRNPQKHTDGIETKKRNQHGEYRCVCSEDVRPMQAYMSPAFNINEQREWKL